MTTGSSHTEGSGNNWDVHGNVEAGITEHVGASAIVADVSVDASQSISVGGSYGQNSSVSDAVNRGFSETASKTTSDSVGKALAMIIRKIFLKKLN